MKRYSVICEYVPELERENDDYLRPVSTEDPEGDFVKYETTKAEIDKLQSKIDMLMLEYCPDEMTREQLSRWGECQKSLDKHKWE